MRTFHAGLLLCALLQAQTAEARFGKAGSGGRSGGGRSGGSRSTHAAVPVGSRGSSSSANSRSNSTVGTFRPYRRLGYFSGAFVPAYGYGYRAAGYSVLLDPREEQSEEGGLRATAGAEFLYFTNQERGYALGLNAALEFDRAGVSVSAQHLTVATDDGTAGNDTLQQVSARLSYSILTGSRGRLRAEAGVDVVFAADAVFAGPTAGFSGTVWIAGPLAFEGSVFGTVYPFWQVDGRAGLVIGMGPLGLRLGWRTQLLDDQGRVDGVARRDVFMGPYAGLGVAF